MKYNLKIFSDFDGTIATKDIGDEIFKDLGQFEPYHTQLVSGEIKIREYWRLLFRTVKPGLDEDKLARYAINFQIDANFKKFAEYCRSMQIPLFITSDGYDAYIRPILKEYGLDWIPFYSNRLEFSAKDTPKPVFPLASESCNCLCASCKRNALLRNFGDNDAIIYIGDGYSDFCAAEHSDIVFAKKSLAAYCNEHRIPHYPFHTFFDVLRILKGQILKGKIKRRHQAQLARLKAFEYE